MALTVGDRFGHYDETVSRHIWPNPMANDVSVEAALPALLEAALDDQPLA